MGSCPDHPGQGFKAHAQDTVPLLGLDVSQALVNSLSSLKPNESLLGPRKPCWFPPQAWGTLGIGSVAHAGLDFSLSVLMILG